MKGCFLTLKPPLPGRPQWVVCFYFCVLGLPLGVVHSGCRWLPKDECRWSWRLKEEAKWSQMMILRTGILLVGSTMTKLRNGIIGPLSMSSMVHCCLVLVPGDRDVLVGRVEHNPRAGVVGSSRHFVWTNPHTLQNKRIITVSFHTLHCSFLHFTAKSDGQKSCLNWISPSVWSRNNDWANVL